MVTNLQCCTAFLILKLSDRQYLKCCVAYFAIKHSQQQHVVALACLKMLEQYDEIRSSVSFALCLALGANTASIALAPKSLFYGHNDLKDHLLLNQLIQPQNKLLEIQLFSSESVLDGIFQTSCGGT